MHLTRLALTDFRSYSGAEVALEPGATTFTGANGAGKTNLIEAAGYVATFASHRVSADTPLIRSGAQRAILRAGVRSAVRDNLIEIEINSGRANRVRLNRVALPRPREALGVLRTVLFAPEDLAIVKGDPEQRRRYLDDLLVASRPRYAAVRSDYERVVRQRTALLKSARTAGRGHPPALEVWDEQLIALGSQLTAGRLRLVAALRPLLTRAYADVSADPLGVWMTYRRRGAGSDDVADPGPGGAARARSAGTGSVPAEPAPAIAPAATVAVSAPPEADLGILGSELRAALERHRRAELERAVCLVGPHRDELELVIGDLPARGYASHGESWSLALALRLAAFGLLRAEGEDPVLILDDVFAELDASRRDRLAELAAQAEQVLVTAAVGADVPARLAGACYAVTGGEVKHA